MSDDEKIEIFKRYVPVIIRHAGHAGEWVWRLSPLDSMNHRYLYSAPLSAAGDGTWAVQRCSVTELRRAMPSITIVDYFNENVAKGKHKCTCDLHKVLLVMGCRCGGV